MLATLFVSSALAQLPSDLCDAAAEQDVSEHVAWLASGLSEEPPVLPEGKEVTYLVVAYDPEVDACVVSGAIVDTGEKLISGSFLGDGGDDTVLSYLLDLVVSAESAKAEAEKALEEGSPDDAITKLLLEMLDDADELIQLALAVRDSDDDDDDGNVWDNW